MPRTEGTFKIPANIEPQASAPLDARQIVPALADLTAAGTFQYPYEGMLVYVRSEQKFFVYKGGVVTSSANWQEVGSGGAEILFMSASALFSKTIGGTTQLSALTAIKHLYDNTSSILEADLIEGVSAVTDTNGTIAVYVGKSDNKYLFKTAQVGLHISYHDDLIFIDNSNSRVIADIIPAEDSTCDLGSRDERFKQLFVQNINAHNVQADNLISVSQSDDSDGGRELFVALGIDVRENYHFIRTYNSIGGQGEEESGEIEIPCKDGVMALLSDIVKNTAGTTNKASTKMYLVGAESQGANPQTYSNSNCYIGTDNCLYSGGTKVLTAHQDISGKAPNNHASSATTYGVGTSSNYGHMKLGAANQNGATAANGVCAPNGHTHSQYLTSHQSLTNLGFGTTGFKMAFIEIVIGTGANITSLKYKNIFGNTTFTARTIAAVTNTINNTTKGIVVMANVSARWVGIANANAFVRVTNAVGDNATGGGAAYSETGTSQYIAIGLTFNLTSTGTARIFLVGLTDSL